MGKGRLALRRETYEKALEVYRESPSNYSEVARRLSCGRRLAKRLYEGPPWAVYPWARPIKLVLEEEAIAAAAQVRRAAEDRARREAEAREADREKARLEHVEALAQEAQVMKVARGDVLAALVLAAELSPAMRSLGRVISNAAKPDPATGLPAIAPAAAMSLITKHALLLQRAIGAAETVIQLARLDRGQSTVNVGVGATGDELSLDEAMAELKALEELMRQPSAPALGAKPNGASNGAARPLEAAGVEVE